MTFCSIGVAQFHNCSVILFSRHGAVPAVDGVVEVRARQDEHLLLLRRRHSRHFGVSILQLETFRRENFTSCRNLFPIICFGESKLEEAFFVVRVCCFGVWAPVHSTVADSVAFWCQQVRRDAPARCALPNVFTCGMNNTGLAPKRMFLIRPTYGIFILYPVTITPEPSLFNGNRRKDLPL